MYRQREAGWRVYGRSTCIKRGVHVYQRVRAYKYIHTAGVREMQCMKCGQVYGTIEGYKCDDNEILDE